MHATGNGNVRALLAGLSEAGRLHSFTTALGWSVDEEPLVRLLPGAGAQISKRLYEAVEPDQIQRAPFREVVRNILLRSGAERLRAAAETHATRGIDWVGRGVSEHAAKSLSSENDVRFVYCYPNQALSVYRAAQRQGVLRVLEVPHAHWRMTRDILVSERERNPAWFTQRNPPSESARWTRESDQELDLADLIVVPSAQVATSLAGLVAGKRVVHAPYGCPPVAATVQPIVWDGEGVLRLLFVGRLNSAKGVANLAQAFANLTPRVHLTVIGAGPDACPPALERFLATVRYLGSVPRPRVLAEMAAAHLLVLPSLVEGRSLAALEALSVGLPILVTPGSGVDDLAERGGGWVVTDEDVPAGIARVVENVLERPETVAETSRAAIALARESGWQQFIQPVLAAM